MNKDFYLKMKNSSLILVLLLVIISFFLGCKKSSYPCPAYNASMSAAMDSTGNFVGGVRKERDRKTGLIKRKKDKNLYDKKR